MSGARNLLYLHHDVSFNFVFLFYSSLHQFSPVGGSSGNYLVWGDCEELDYPGEYRQGSESYPRDI